MTIEAEFIIAMICLGIAIISLVIIFIVKPMWPALKNTFNFKKRKQIKKQLRAIINEIKQGEIKE